MFKLKNIKYFIYLFFLLNLLKSCVRKNDVSLKGDGDSKALFNKKKWLPAPFAWLNDDNDKILIMFAFNNNNGRKEELIFYNVEKKLDIQNINYNTQNQENLFCIFSVTDHGHDMGCDYYQILLSNTVENWIHIKEQSSNFSKIEGEFNVTLVRESTCQHSPYPDTIKITDGEFNITKVK